MQIRSRKALDETAITMKTTKINKITKTSKFCRAIDEKWRGNANEVKEGPPRNSENNENFEILQGLWRKGKWGQWGPSTKQEKLRKVLTKNGENNKNLETLPGHWRKVVMRKCKWGPGRPSTKQPKIWGPLLMTKTRVYMKPRETTWLNIFKNLQKR